MMRLSIPTDRVRALEAAIAAAVFRDGTPRSPEVDRLLRVIVQELLDAGAGARDVHALLEPLFRELRAPYQDPAIRSTLDVLHTQARSHALAQDASWLDRRPDPDEH